ncbi:MAG: Aspartyl/glutamyl-tRNA(Asn/Gln) amidotransferase subunit [Gemmatimonadetes bacterium]|nr:Aspartyl/glutamyl-tRNA(Asn/Gln) amidotransferase subunit [Gemmatimonadota bacterium]
MAVTIEDVRHIALLARLGLDDARATSLVQELNGILGHMEALGKVDTDGVAEVSGIGASGMPLRPDHGPGVLLKRSPEGFAPMMREGFFLVPRLSTHEDAGDSA